LLVSVGICPAKQRLAAVREALYRGGYFKTIFSVMNCFPEAVSVGEASEKKQRPLLQAGRIAAINDVDWEVWDSEHLVRENSVASGLQGELLHVGAVRHPGDTPRPVDLAVYSSAFSEKARRFHATPNDFLMTSPTLKFVVEKISIHVFIQMQRWGLSEIEYLKRNLPMNFLMPVFINRSGEVGDYRSGGDAYPRPTTVDQCLSCRICGALRSFCQSLKFGDCVIRVLADLTGAGTEPLSGLCICGRRARLSVSSGNELVSLSALRSHNAFYLNVNDNHDYGGGCGDQTRGSIHPNRGRPNAANEFYAALYVVMACVCYFGGMVGMAGRWSMYDWRIWVCAKIVGVLLIISFIALIVHSFNLVNE